MQDDNKNRVTSTEKCETSIVKSTTVKASISLRTAANSRLEQTR